MTEKELLFQDPARTKVTSIQVEYDVWSIPPLKWTSDEMHDLSKHVARQPPSAFRSMTKDGRVQMLDSESNGTRAKAVYRLLREEQEVSTAYKAR